MPFVSELQTMNARVLDVSRSGMCLNLPVPLEPGTWLQIEMTTVVETGEVRHCRSAGDLYVIGVQLDEVGNKGRTKP